jgi:sugar phosphate isomerase/epimerase
MKPPFGVSQYTTWPLTFGQDLELYRRAGIEWIEVCEAKLSAKDPGAQLERLAASGLRVSSVQPRFHSPFPNSLRPLPAAPGPRMRHLRASIRLFGRHFPGTTLVVNTGLAPRGNVARAHEQTVREFRKIAEMADDHGVRIGFEPLNPVYMNTDTFICTLSHGGRLLEEVDHPAFGLFLDVWHFWEEPDALQLIRRHKKKLFGVHVSDWRLPRAFGDRLLPGSGEIPLVRLLRGIRRAGYSGVYTLEIFSDRRLKDSLWAHPERTLVRGRDAFRRLWSKL